MGGRNCCVVNCRRRSHDHRGRKIPNGLTFHCFPSWRRQEGEQISRLTESRRAAWVAAVDRPDITFNQIPTSMRVCSRHFHSELHSKSYTSNSIKIYLMDSANDQTRKDQASERKPRRPPRFQKAWLKQFWFLRYSQTLDHMWCHVCRLHSDKSHHNNGLIKGSRLFRFQSIKQHSASNYHKDCASRHMLNVCSL